MTSLAIETHGLGKRFGERAALESIDLEVPRGCAFGFLGRNGAGKTTLVRLLLGLAQPTSGTMRLLGHDLPGGPRGGARPRRRDRRGAALPPAPDRPREPARPRRGARRERARPRRRRAEAGRASAGRADDKVKTYSLGMRQRLGVARCLLCDPELLILDEPVNGLDPAGILEFRGLVRSLVDEGRTVLLSSHLLDEVEKTCDFAAIVDEGRVDGPGHDRRADRAAASARSTSSPRPTVKAAGVLAGVPAVPARSSTTAASARRSPRAPRATSTSSPCCCAACWPRASRSSA